MLWFLLELIVVLIIGYISYCYWFFFQTRKKLSWIPAAPLVPIFGTALEFGKNTTEFLENCERLSNNPAKSFYYELGLEQHGFLTKEHDLIEFLLSSSKLALLNKSNDYRIFEPWLGTGLLTAAGPKWKKRRRIITPAFHFSILEQFVEVFDTNGNILIQRMQNEVVDKKSVDIYKYMTSYTLDIISESAMCVSVNSQEGKNNDYVVSVKEICGILVKRAFSAFFRNDFLFRFHPDYRKSQHHLKVMHDFTNKVISRKLEEAKTKNNEKTDDNLDGKKRRLAFLDLLLNATIDGKPLSKEDIREEVDTFMFEGHDTTSFAIAAIVYLLGNHPDIQTLARNEQKEIFGDDKTKPTTLQDLNNMPYLDMVIKESLRVYPSVPVIGRIATEDVEYQGNIIPKGTQITIFIFGMNHDPDYHENPESFTPERHLTSNNKFFSYVPFSAGPRNCIGQKFAMLEMKSALSKILRNFEILPASPAHKPILAMEAILRSTNGINISLKNLQ